MARKASKTKIKLAESGFEAFEARDWPLAERYLTRAIERDRSNANVRLCLAITLEHLGDVDASAREYCEVLALRAGHSEALQRLSSLLRRFRVEDVGGLSAAGLKAAIGPSTPAVQLVINTALRRLEAAGDLADPLAQVRFGHADATAADLLRKGQKAATRNELLLRSLAFGKVINVPMEHLLTAMRKELLLNVPSSQMTEDKFLFQFVLALVKQCEINEYVWPVADVEQDALSELRIDQGRLLAGDVSEAWTLCLELLYQPFDKGVLRGASRDDVRRIRPKALTEYLMALVDNRSRDRDISAAIPRLSAPEDPVGERVARHYEANPYPRWKSLQTSQPGALRRKLGDFFDAPSLAFMDQPYDVLIAGCGTGQQACQSAAGYGENARFLAIDISLASLTYAQRMAQELAITNVEFAQADIMDLATWDRDFDVIESVGVLHHMADPGAGCQAIAARLKPNGLMYLGFYSQISRRSIAALHHEDGYPGADCTDDAARAYRQALMLRKPGEAGHELLASHNFYSLNEFRDLVLNPNEHHLRLEDIEALLATCGLTFRGFTIDPQAWSAFSKMFPDDPWPGQLSNWGRLEEERPRTFDAMYRFWCQRA